MTESLHRVKAAPPQPGRRRFALWVWLALVLAAPGAAYPMSLEQLLEMPLEQLLQMEISPPRTVQAEGDAGFRSQLSPSERGHHAR